MNDRVLIHAVWASAFMYVAAVVCLTAVAIQRPPETGEATATKLLAIFGPTTLLLSAVLFRRNGSSNKPSQAP